MNIEYFILSYESKGSYFVSGTKQCNHGIKSRLNKYVVIGKSLNFSELHQLILKCKNNIYFTEFL